MARIIFCEDEIRIQKLIQVTLRSTEHTILIASDGREGLTQIEHNHPDLIFTDISMPHCDGFQLAKELKARPHLAHIPIIFLTAFAQQTEIEEGYLHGAASYMIKPFSPTELREKVEEYVHYRIKEKEKM